MDRTLLTLEILGQNTIGMKDEFDTDFADFEFNFVSGFGKHNSRNHMVIGIGDAFTNKSGVIFTLKDICNGVIVFHICSWHAYYPSVDKDICVRPGLVAAYLGAGEISVIGAQAIYNIDKTIEGYIFSRFNKIPNIYYGRIEFDYNVHKVPKILHDGTERKDDKKLYIEKASYFIEYEVVNSKINLIKLYCVNKNKLPSMYKSLHELAYRVTVNNSSNIDINNL